MMNNRTLEKNVIDGDEMLPSREILTGKVYKQYGKFISPHGTVDYFIERIPNTEQQMQVVNGDLNVIDVDAVEFEIYVKHSAGDDWSILEKGPMPTDPDLYNTTNPIF